MRQLIWLVALSTVLVLLAIQVNNVDGKAAKTSSISLADCKPIIGTTKAECESKIPLCAQIGLLMKW